MRLSPGARQITESGHQAVQYKKVVDALPVFCVDKNYRNINNIICTNTKLQEAAFLPTYPDARRWSSTYHMNVLTVNLNAAEVNGDRPTRIEVHEKLHVFNPNL